VFLARTNANGTLDTTFGEEGIVFPSLGSQNFHAAQALAIQPRDGRLVVAGTASPEENPDFALARYHAHTCRHCEQVQNVP
jgi:hypothetical protein